MTKNIVRKKSYFVENLDIITFSSELEITTNPFDFILNPEKYYKDKNGQKIHFNKDPAFLIIYKFHEVLMIKLSFNDDFKVLIENHLNPRFLRSFRLFSQKWELHLWRACEKKDELKEYFSWRYLKDLDSNNKSKIHAFDEHHIIWGTRFERDDDHNVGNLREQEQGIKIKIYHPDLNITDDTELPLMYCARNYFKFDNEDVGLIKFFDARLVHLCKNNQKENKCEVLK